MHEIVDGYGEGCEAGGPHQSGLDAGPEAQHAARDGPTVDLVHHV